MSVATMEELFVDELKDLYSAEKQITRALPKIAKGVTSEELKRALLDHLEETNGQVARLEQAFEILGKRPAGKICIGMKGVLEEGSHWCAIDPRVAPGPGEPVYVKRASSAFFGT